MVHVNLLRAHNVSPAPMTTATAPLRSKTLLGVASQGKALPTIVLHLTTTHAFIYRSADCSDPDYQLLMAAYDQRCPPQSEEPTPTQSPTTTDGSVASKSEPSTSEMSSSAREPDTTSSGAVETTEASTPEPVTSTDRFPASSPGWVTDTSTTSVSTVELQSSASSVVRETQTTSSPTNTKINKAPVSTPYKTDTVEVIVTEPCETETKMAPTSKHTHQLTTSSNGSPQPQPWTTSCITKLSQTTGSPSVPQQPGTASTASAPMGSSTVPPVVVVTAGCSKQALSVGSVLAAVFVALF